MRTNQTTELSLKSMNDRMVIETDEIFLEIMEQIRLFEPMELLEMSTVLLMFSNNIVEGTNDFLTQSQLEFVIGLLLTSLNNEYVKNSGKKDIMLLADKVREYFLKWSMVYQYKKMGFSDQANSEKERLVASLVTHHAFVRGDAYFEQTKQQLTDLFVPFNVWFDQNLGFNIQDVLLFLETFIDYQEEGVNKLLVVFKELPKNKNEVKNKKKLAKKYNNENLKIDYDELWSKIKGALIFTEESIREFGSLEEKSNQLHKFLQKFCSIYNETINLQFRTPIDENTFRAKPFFKCNNEIILSSLNTLLWCFQVVFEQDLKTDNKQWQKYQKHKGKYLETEAAATFKKIFPTAQFYPSLFYQTKVNNELRKFELDCVIIYDSNIILVESKSGNFSDAARRGGVLRLERNIRDNIEAAYEQAFRARDYIYNNDTPTFVDEHNREVLKIEKSHYYKIFMLNVTLDNFGEVATMIHQYHKANLYKYEEYPYSLNLNDLKIISEYVSFPTQFLHYIHRRLKINNRIKNSATVVTTDELDLFGYYLEKNLYFEGHSDSDQIFIPDYAPFFHHNHVMKITGGPIELLEQTMDSKFKSIMTDLEQLNQFGFSNIILNLLEMSENARGQLMKYFEVISNKTTQDGLFHDFSTFVYNNPNDSKSGIGFTLTTGLLRDREEMVKRLAAHCQLKKYQQRCFEWVGLGKYVDSKVWAIDEAVFLRYEEEHDPELEKIATNVLKGTPVFQQKVGRNEKCPCGSGLKFKKCHGFQQVKT
ncbi:SEC-C domain-containing protein [Paenibacillus frigoriresistens]|uniref:YecA family protein n=1 Tax=Paenibacillus alginolyticus TaxID=59839 RepID=UPI0015633FDF|nr:SEC-C metal-binding domain-containing protein [Paenibacillus frigoriresistens]NRF89863.1 SEC-C domain-containing protein [Paenibacillus frigoriresistens]